MLSSSTLITALIATVAAQNTTCVSGNAVHMIIARASTEPPGPGIIGQVGTQVAQQLPGSDMVSVVYPATLNNYASSEDQGVVAMTQLITDYASRCPSSKMVLMGYSQGAQVTADVLCGRSEAGGSSINFTTTQPVPAAVADKVAAVVLMGDPSKVTTEKFLQGNSTKNGVFPRQNVAGCGAVADRMVSYCNANDTFCDSGNSLQVHISYVQTNGPAAVSFVVGQVNGSAAGGWNGNSTNNSATAAVNAKESKAGLIWGAGDAMVWNVGFGVLAFSLGFSLF